MKSKPKGEKVRDDESEDDIEKEKEKDKMAFLNAIKGLREKDKGKAGLEKLARVMFRIVERARNAALAAAQALGRPVEGLVS